jgi:pyruvate formate lyase activating enzyme
VVEMNWSGHIVSTLEFSGNMSFVIFTGGCNLRCLYCHNPELIDDEEHISLEELYIKIQDSIDFIDAVVITGGKPLLQSNDTKKIFNYYREFNIKTKLDTNGCYPKRLKNIASLLDYCLRCLKRFLISIKKIIGADVGDLVNETMKICYNNPEIFLECRTTYVPSLMKPDDVKKIAQTIKCDLYTLQQFRNRRVLDENYITYQIQLIMSLLKLLTLSHLF